MFMAFFSTESRATPRKGGVPVAQPTRWSGLGKMQQNRSGADDGQARSAHQPATAAASEAERARRLRASFEDDLAHFLRTSANTPAE
jgi:hypothetical protein